MTSEDNAADLLIAQAQKSFAEGFAGVIKLAPDGAPPVWVDGRTTPPAVIAHEPEDHPADCQWRGSSDALMRVLESEKALESDYLSGRVFISGDMSVMARLSMKAHR
ncbi:MAG: SCP2 sterol-binding domain-containing protein [Pseudomonadota bacterium]